MKNQENKKTINFVCGFELLMDGDKTSKLKYDENEAKDVTSIDL